MKIDTVTTASRSDVWHRISKMILFAAIAGIMLITTTSLTGEDYSSEPDNKLSAPGAPTISGIPSTPPLTKRLRETSEIKSTRLADAPATNLRLRRWHFTWNGPNRGTLTLEFGNYGDKSIHLNKIGLRGRWTLIGQFISAGHTLTYRIVVDHEPIRIDMDTSDGPLRFDLIPDR